MEVAIQTWASSNPLNMTTMPDSKVLKQEKPVPKFNGTPDEYFDWIYTFRTLAEAPNITPTNRVQMLQEALTGEAKEMYMGFTMANDMNTYSRVIRQMYYNYESDGKLVGFNINRIKRYTIVRDDPNKAMRLYHFIETMLRGICMTPICSYVEFAEFNVACRNKIEELEPRTTRRLRCHLITISKTFFREGPELFFDMRWFLDVKALEDQKVAFNNKTLSQWAESANKKSALLKGARKKETRKLQSHRAELEQNNQPDEEDSERTDSEQEYNPTLSLQTLASATSLPKKPEKKECGLCGGCGNEFLFSCPLRGKCTPRAVAAVATRLKQCPKCLKGPKNHPCTMPEDCPVCNNKGHGKLTCFAKSKSDKKAVLDMHAMGLITAAPEESEADATPAEGSVSTAAAQSELDSAIEMIRTQYPSWGGPGHALQKPKPTKAKSVASNCSSLVTERPRSIFSMTLQSQAWTTDIKRKLRCLIFLDSGSDVSWVRETLY